MSRLYLRLPSSADAHDLANARDLPCSYALVASGAIEHQGIATLPELSATLAQVERVILLVAASDVTLLRLRVPPLSPARLKAALPNLVEEHLISNSADCILVAGAPEDGMRTVAVVQRAWLETIAKALADDDVRSAIAVPAQLCLSSHPDAACAIVDWRADQLAVTLRLSPHEGLGIALAPSSSPDEVIDAITAVARDAPLTLHVPDDLLGEYRSAMQTAPDLARRVTLDRADWSCWLQDADKADLDLLSGVDHRHGDGDAWRRWRWPIALAAGLVAINVVGLYADWWRMKSEADGARSAMLRTFMTTYPKETVILDPAAQMKQKIAADRAAAGQFAPDDFLMLVSALGDAASNVPRGAPAGKTQRIASLEYRERSLSVRTQSGADGYDERVASALKARGLSLTRTAAGAWQIRSGSGASARAARAPGGKS